MAIPKRGEFGEWLARWPGCIAAHQYERAVVCAVAMEACDPDKLGELIRACRTVGRLPNDDVAVYRMLEALDAFTERKE